MIFYLLISRFIISKYQSLEINIIARFLKIISITDFLFFAGFFSNYERADFRFTKASTFNN